jgi:hypothetical protein
LGEFSPIDTNVYFERFYMPMLQVSSPMYILGYIFSAEKVTYVLILVKHSSGNILDDFSQTHLVTLIGSETLPW